MCGIAGKYNYTTGQPVSPELIKAMCDRIVYRGPDDGGVYVEGPVGLGHRRLSILDLSELGHQPMATPDRKIWITYNGEVYNFKNLRKELEKKGYTFRSNCDTEVILSLYQEYGTECLQHLRGMFAFAIWDLEKSQLFLARDRIGKKPLFYYHDGKTFIFASEIKSLLADPGVGRKIRADALYDYFKYQYVPDPKTIYQNIFKLEPAHFLLCSNAGIKKEPYWDISFSSPLTGDVEEIAGRLLEILNESVKMRMISDVPLGAFLSGGIDSSGVVALMAQNQVGPVTTCSIGFDSNDFDEIDYARTIARKFATDHHEFTVKQKAGEILENLAYYFDEPFADPSAVPTYYVSQLARQRVTVALSGDGGDENFAGYEKYFLDDIENRIRRKVPRFIRRALLPRFSRLLSRGDRPIWRKGTTLLNTLGHEADYGFYLTNTEFADSFLEGMMQEDLKRQVNGYDPFSVTEYHYHRADTEDHLSRILYTDLKTYLPGDILVKVDRMSMAHSLEVRAPILDHPVIEFAASLPARLKYNRGEKKYILKQAFRRMLPPEVMYRKKMGFSVPLAGWLRGELKEFTENRLFAGISGLSNFIKVTPLRKMWEDHQSGNRNYSSNLWCFLMFELWFRKFMC